MAIRPRNRIIHLDYPFAFYSAILTVTQQNLPPSEHIASSDMATVSTPNLQPQAPSIPMPHNSPNLSLTTTSTAAKPPSGMGEPLGFDHTQTYFGRDY